MDIQNVAQLPLVIVNLLAADNPTAAWIEWGLAMVVVAIFVASLSFWCIAFIRLNHNQELIPYQRSECVLGFIDVVLLFAVWLGAQMAVGVVLMITAGPGAMSGGEDAIFEKHGVLLLYLSAVFGIASLIAGSVYLFVRYQTTNSFGLRFGQVAKQVGYGVVVFTMFFPITLLVQYLLSLLVEYDHPVLSVLAANPTFFSIFGCWAAAVLAAPFVEEFLFRGVFQHWLERLSVSKLNDDSMLLGGSSLAVNGDSVGDAFNDKPGLPTAELVEPNGFVKAVTDADLNNPYRSLITPANAVEDEGLTKFAYWPIFVSSLCFALVHFGQGLAPIPLFILALGLGYLFRQTGSLIACITVHFLLNFYSMLVFTVMILLGETP